MDACHGITIKIKLIFISLPPNLAILTKEEDGIELSISEALYSGNPASY